MTQRHRLSINWTEISPTWIKIKNVSIENKWCVYILYTHTLGETNGLNGRSLIIYTSKFHEFNCNSTNVLEGITTCGHVSLYWPITSALDNLTGAMLGHHKLVWTTLQIGGGATDQCTFTHAVASEMKHGKYSVLYGVNSENAAWIMLLCITTVCGGLGTGGEQSINLWIPARHSHPLLPKGTARHTLVRSSLLWHRSGVETPHWAAPLKCLHSQEAPGMPTVTATARQCGKPRQLLTTITIIITRAETLHTFLGVCVYTVQYIDI